MPLGQRQGAEAETLMSNKIQQRLLNGPYFKKALKNDFVKGVVIWSQSEERKKIVAIRNAGV